MPDSFGPTLLLLLLTFAPAIALAQSTGAASSSGADGTALVNSSSGSFIFANSTNSTNASALALSSSALAESSTALLLPQLSSTGRGSDDIPPGGTIGHGDSSFGSTNAVFLTTIRDVWIGMILWTMVFTAFFFFAAGVIAVRVNRHNRCGWKIFTLPPLMLIVGAAVGFMHGAVSAVLIAAITICQLTRR